MLWKNWQKFNGEQIDPGDSTDYVVPTLASSEFSELSMADYFGIPTDVPGLTPNAFHFRAYNLIYNEWFRDQNLQDSLDIENGDGPDDPAKYTIQKRNKRHDYFTSCLPWPQKGEAVTLPLGMSAPLSEDSARVQTDGFNSDTMGIFSTSENYVTTAFDGNPFTKYGAQQPTSKEMYANLEGITADLTQASAITVNELRQSFQIQRMLERDARGGSRYIEIIKAHFGVISPDSRLQRPEYLGGGSSHVIINPIQQTSATDETTPQGNLAAQGTAALHNHGFIKSFTEHSVILGFISVRADLTYQQGLNRMWSRRTRYDFYWPALAHIGEQAVLNKELFTQGSADADADEEVFGYQERFAEYRYSQSLITGLFRSTNTLTLDAWHLAQEFESLPVLNSDFISENPPIDRIIAVQDQPDFIFDSYFQLACTRPMPVYSVPGQVDHF